MFHRLLHEGARGRPARVTHLRDLLRGAPAGRAPCEHGCASCAAGSHPRPARTSPVTEHLLRELRRSRGFLLHLYLPNCDAQDGSDVVQASPFYTVVSAAGSQFCCKDCRCGLVYEAARQRCHDGQKIETPLSLFLVSVSLNTSTKACPGGACRPGLSREGGALHTQHAKHTAGNTHRHRRAWGRGLENLALPLRARPSRK